METGTCKDCGGTVVGKGKWGTLLWYCRGCAMKRKRIFPDAIGGEASINRVARRGTHKKGTYRYK